MKETSEPKRGNHSKGRPVELFVAAYCMLASKNQLNMLTSYVDDDGVDLVLKRWQREALLAIQVKACFVGSKGVDDNREFTCKLNPSTFRASDDSYVLLTVVDEGQVKLDPIWLVPSTYLKKSSLQVRINLNTVGQGMNQWDRFLVTIEDLPSHVLQILDSLEVRS
jgi:hypothetical protein